MAEQEAQDQEPIEQQTEGAPESAPSFLESLYPELAPENESEEIEGETKADDESEVPEEDQESGNGDEEVVSSLSELIEHEGWDQEWFNNLKVPVKVDGEQAETTVGDLIASHQMREMAEKYLSEAKEQKKSQTKELHQEREAVKAEYGTALGLVQLAEQLFAQEQQDLSKLREEDPQGYLVAKDQLTERRRAIETVKGHLRDQLQQTLSQSQPQPPSEETYAEARQKLVGMHPELSDTDKRAELGEYVLTKAGFSPEEVSAQTDPRLFSLAYKAMLFDRSQEKVATARKKVVRIPKAMKPGATNTPTKEAPKDHASILYGNS